MDWLRNKNLSGIVSWIDLCTHSMECEFSLVLAPAGKKTIVVEDAREESVILWDIRLVLKGLHL